MLRHIAAAVLAVALVSTAERADAAFVPATKDRTLILTGDAAADKLALRLPAHAPSTLDVDFGDDGSADLSVARSQLDRVLVRAGDGDDRVRIDDSGSRAAVPIPTSIDGQGGADTLLGGRAADDLSGGDGEDVVDGNGGSDVARLGAGNDQFRSDPADGSDAVEGGDGFDTLVFNGSDTDEAVRLAADGARARITRDVGAVNLGWTLSSGSTWPCWAEATPSRSKTSRAPGCRR